MTQSVKLADDIMELVRREAELQNRSVAEQIAHWLKIGRAIEYSGTSDYGQVKLALGGRLDATELTEGEEAAWLEEFTNKMAEPTADEHKFFTERRMLGLGVGLDASGNLIYAKDGAAA